VTAAGASDDVPSFDCPFRFPDVDYGSTHARAIDALARQEIMGGRATAPSPRLPSSPAASSPRSSPVPRACRPPRATASRTSRAAPTRVRSTPWPTRASSTGTPTAPSVRRSPVQRDQAAAILARWLELAPVEVDAFSDIAGTTHRRRINALAGIDVALGTADGRYLPGRTIRRDQAASLLSRTLQHLEAETVAR
jgi:hypothetical protein